MYLFFFYSYLELKMTALAFAKTFMICTINDLFSYDVFTSYSA
jgi:hypothetical protein